jgi:hypothetical protein
LFIVEDGYLFVRLVSFLVSFLAFLLGSKFRECRMCDRDNLANEK